MLGRAEIVARGADEARRLAEAALDRGDALEARNQARALLARVPRSSLGRALLADAAERAGFDDEACEALEALCEAMPWRLELFTRVGQLRQRLGRGDARVALERAATDTGEAGIEARLGLCDFDLAGGDAARASRWLVGHPTGADHGREIGRELALRRAECALRLGHLAAAREALGLLGAPERPDGRDRLARATLATLDARAAEELGIDATRDALGAFVLDAPGAEACLAALVPALAPAARERIAAVVAAAGRGEAPRWLAAFALAEGRADEARQALARALRDGDEGAEAPLLALAMAERDEVALRALADRQALVRDVALLAEALALRAAGRVFEAIGALASVHGEPAESWASDALGELYASLVPAAADASANWAEVLSELRRVIRALDRLEFLGTIEALAVERERPLRVAILGEFNAGKSTMVNALLGTDVAPTGVRPTTAVLHWVAWAPDPFARVLVRGDADRVVSHDELKRALAEVEQSGRRVDRVYIYAPFERLKRVELLDTPGFNAPDPAHAARARSSFSEAHVALWLLDATAPLKETERAVMAELGALGIPVQLVVNKADRLAPGEIERVVRYVGDAITTAGLESQRPPVAVSARLALAGRLTGDTTQLEGAGWPAFETMLGEAIVDRADALRERALRRKARALCTELATHAERTLAASADDVARRTRIAATALQLASRLEADSQFLTYDAERAVAAAEAELGNDARPLARFAAQQASGADRDAMRRYLVERTKARLGPLVEQLALRPPGADRRPGAPADAAVPTALSPTVHACIDATLAGAAASCAPAVLGEEPLRAAVATALAAAGHALRLEAEETEPARADTGLRLRLTLLGRALERS